MKIQLFKKLFMPKIIDSKPVKFLTPNIDISHNLKTDTIAFCEKSEDKITDEMELCNEIINDLYDQKTKLTNFYVKTDDDSYQRFLVSLKDESTDPATLVLTKSNPSMRTVISIQEHKNPLFDIGILKVFDENGNLIKYLSPEQAKTLRNYRGNTAAIINHLLRDGEDLTYWEDEITNMDSLFNNPKIYSTLDKDTMLYRGIQLNNYNKKAINDKLKVEKVFNEKGYCSTTTNSERVNNYGNCYLQILAPKGTKYIDMHVLTSPSEYYINESEILLNRNSKMRITDYKKDTNTYSAILVDE